MRILMLTQGYPPLIGGEERHVRNLSAELAERGHDVSVATIWHKGMLRFELDRGVRIYRIPSAVQRAEFLFEDKRRFCSPPFPDPELARRLRRIVRREKPHIVHAHNWIVYSFLPLKGWSGAKLVLSLHNQSLICPVINRVYREARCTGPRWTKCLECAGRRYGSLKGALVVAFHKTMGLFERASVDMFVPVNRCYAEDNMLTAGRLPFRVIHNFIPDDIDVVPEGLHAELTSRLPREDFILFVGALARYKGVHTLIEAYREMKGAPPLAVIGYETPENPLHTMQLPPGVTVLPDWPHEAVMHAWRRCLFGVVPSLYSDPIPTVALEAMASGKALVASRVGGLPDLVADGEAGIIVEPGDPADLRRAMETLIANPDRRIRMGAAARRKVVAFKAASVVPRIEQLYVDLLSRRS